jgi:hypothetical protein
MGFRNPRTEFASFGYGKSEVEECLEAVIGILYGMNANKEYFTNNHVPMGVLNLIGQYSPEDLEAMRTAFKMQVGGPGHYYEVPVIKTQPGQGTGASWIPMQQRDRMDMVFRAYIEMCVALVSAVFQIAPEEFGFASFGGATQVLSEADPESTIQQSQNKGLIPKVLFFSDWLSRTLVEKIDPDFELVIQGLESRYNPEELLRAQLDLQLMQLGYSPNMIRARNDEPPIIDPLDPDLWREVEKQFNNRWYPNDTARYEDMIDAYQKRGGQLGSWPNLPVNCAGAMQIVMSEHGLQQDQEAQAQMGEQAAGAEQADRDQEAGDNDEARAGMAGMEQFGMEQDNEKSMQDAEAQTKGEMRIPGRPDAGNPKLKKGPDLRSQMAEGKPKKPAGKSPGKVRKSLINQSTPTGRPRRRVITIVSEDEGQGESVRDAGGGPG